MASDIGFGAASTQRRNGPRLELHELRDTRLPTPLSGREEEIADLLPLGLTNKEIAERLCLSPETIKTYVARIIRKLGARNRTEAACKTAVQKFRDHVYRLPTSFMHLNQICAEGDVCYVIPKPINLGSCEKTSIE